MAEVETDDGGNDVPEALQALQYDVHGVASPSRWRDAAADVAALDYAGTGRWTQVGPAPLLIANEQIYQGLGPNSGQIIDIAVDPRGGSQHTLYAATGNGGLWKSVDSGGSWQPLTDPLEACVGAVALDPGNPDIVYIGTGNLFSGAAGMPKSAGLFRSDDGGASWSQLATPTARPPQPITGVTTLAAGLLELAVPHHGYEDGAQVIAVGLPGIVGAAGKFSVLASGPDAIMMSATLSGPPYTTGAILYDGAGSPFLRDVGVNRIVCPAPGALLVATEKGLFYSKDYGRNFGANDQLFNDGRPIRAGFVSALALDTGWTSTRRIGNATATSPVVLTVPGHGFSSGDRVFVGGLGGPGGLDGADGGWLVDVPTIDAIALRGSTGTGTPGGRGWVIGPRHVVARPIQSTSSPAAPAPIVVTSAGHGLVTGDVVAVSGLTRVAGGTSSANGSWSIRVLDADTFELVGARANGAITAGTGSIDGPTHPAPITITAAVQHGDVITLTVAGHGLVSGDLISVDGLPGITAPQNSAAVLVLGPTTLRISGLHMSGAYAGATARLRGPADSWNTAYFAVSGNDSGGGLYRLAITSSGSIVVSEDLLGHPAALPLVTAGFNRVIVAQSQAPRTNVLYTVVQNGDGDSAILVGMFRSDDWGQTWTLQPNANVIGTNNLKQTTYDFTIGVDPQHPDYVYVALQQLWRSTDSGGSFVTPPPANAGGLDRSSIGAVNAVSTMQLHWDHHALTFAPATHWPAFPVPTSAQPAPFTPLYLGTDGGIALATGLTTAKTSPMRFKHLNEGFATSLFRGIDIGRGAGSNAVTFGGMQDTGTAGHRALDPRGPWMEGIDGDGGPVAVDPLDPDIVYGFDNARFIRTTNGGQTWFADGWGTGAHIARPLILGVRNENPVRVITAGHPFQTGDSVTVAGVTAGGHPSAVGNGAATVTVLNSREFTLNSVQGSAAPAFDAVANAHGPRYLDQRSVTGATATNPIVLETATAHGCSTGDKVRVDGVQGLVQANNDDVHPTWTVTVVDNTHLTLQGSTGLGAAPYVPGSGRMSGPGRPGDAAVVFATKATPTVVVAQGHHFMSGDSITVSGLRAVGGAGPMTANATATIRVIDANSFEMTGVTGNVVTASGPAVSGPTVGRGLPVASSWRTRVVACRAVPPAAGAPAAEPVTVFVSQDAQLYRSTDRGISFTLMQTFPDPITALHATIDNRLWVGTTGASVNPTGGQVYFSTDGGSTLVSGGYSSVIGARGPIAAIAEDPAVAAGTRVAVVVSGYSESAAPRRTRHCFLTETGGHPPASGLAWKEVGGVTGAAHGNLPDVPVLGVGWDTSTTPSTLLAATEFGVLRLGPANVWQQIGPNLPTISCQSLAIDNTVNPPVIRVGTYGRSAWEFTIPAAASLHVSGDLGFGDAQVGQTLHRRIVLHSTGTGPVTVSAIDGVGGDFALSTVPSGAVSFPLVVASGTRTALDVAFTPSVAGVRSTSLVVRSDDPDHPAVPLAASGFGAGAGQPRLSLRNALEFGVVKVGQPVQLSVDITNIGTAPLTVDSVRVGPGAAEFALSSPVTTPLVIAPAATATVRVRFAPTANGARNSSLVVRAGDQGAVVSLSGSGLTAHAAAIAAALFATGVSNGTLLPVL